MSQQERERDTHRSITVLAHEYLSDALTECGLNGDVSFPTSAGLATALNSSRVARDSMIVRVAFDELVDYRHALLRAATISVPSVELWAVTQIAALRRGDSELYQQARRAADDLMPGHPITALLGTLLDNAQDGDVINMGRMAGYVKRQLSQEYGPQIIWEP